MFPNMDYIKQLVEGLKFAANKRFVNLEKFAEDAKAKLTTLLANRPDWNQNDPTALDHVQNRPFHIEYGEKSIACKNDESTVLDGFPVFAIGDTVNVEVDGTAYSLVAYDDEGCVTIGDSFADLESGSGQLGWQIYIDDNEIWFYSGDEHAVSYQCEVVHRLNKKYIPNYEYLCLDVSAYLGDFALVTQLSTGTVVYSVDQSFDFYSLPAIGIGMFGSVGFIECYPYGTFCGMKCTLLNERGVNIINYVFVHSDNVEQGIADYKAAYGE